VLEWKCKQPFNTDKEAIMHYVGIDLHKYTLVTAIETDQGPVGHPVTIPCKDTEKIRTFFENLRPFRSVIEASGSYRWLHDLLSPLGEVVLAHPRRLKAIVEGRAKTDKLDAKLLAKLLRVNMIPTAYVPPRRYMDLRDICRARARLARHMTHSKNEIHALLSRENIHPPFKTPFCRGWIRFVSQTDLGFVGNATRDEILRRMDHYRQEIEALDVTLSKMAESFPEVQAITCLPGIGLFSALLIVGEIGEPSRFRGARQVGAYAGLTPRVDQSGGHCYYGSITRQGSSWLRWVLVQAAMKAAKHDKDLANFYTRVRKRSSAKIARVAVARKLAGICWIRLLRDRRGRDSV
jgi:transposase